MTTTAPHTADLEPSLVAARTYVTRRRSTRVDAAVVLSVLIGLITLVPARLIVLGMTDLARPGLILGFLMFCWWILVRFTSHLVLVGPQPIRWAVLAYVVALLASYASGFLRGLTTMEANGADRWMLFSTVFVGVTLMTADGVPNWHRLRKVLQVLVWCASVCAVIGLLQFALAVDITQYIIIPGLQAKGWVPGFEVRGAGIRVASTTAHYIEFSTIMAMALPLAIHLACFTQSPRRRRAFIVAALTIAAAIPVTISRTGLIAVAIMFLVMVPVWGWRLRYNIAALSTGLIAALIVVKPSLFGTLTGLFSNLQSNPAVTVRTERYPLAFHYVSQRPWLGRGTGTWLPPQYQILDNNWLTYLVTNGMIGVAALAALHITGITLAGIALRRSSSSEHRHLCAALISIQLMAIVVAGTFDSMAFTTYVTLLAFSLGLCGAVWRLTHPERRVRTSTTRWFAD